MKTKIKHQPPNMVDRGYLVSSTCLPGPPRGLVFGLPREGRLFFGAAIIEFVITIEFADTIDRFGDLWLEGFSQQ